MPYYKPLFEKYQTLNIYDMCKNEIGKETLVPIVLSSWNTLNEKYNIGWAENLEQQIKWFQKVWTYQPILKEDVTISAVTKYEIITF